MYTSYRNPFGGEYRLNYDLIKPFLFYEIPGYWSK